MKLSRLLQFLHPDARVRMDCQTFKAAEILGYMSNETWEGGDPNMTIRVLEHSFDLYNLDRPAHRRHCGWIEPVVGESLR